MMRLSLVIPCYNEAKNIQLLLDRCSHVFTRQDCELVLVNNGSTDDSAAVFEALVPSYPFARNVTVPVNQGYGFGILQGLRAATGKVLAWTHADLQTDPGDTFTALKLFDSHPNPEKLFVKGRRFGRPPADVLFTMGMSMFETLLLRHRLWDINAQPTVFSREFFSTWQSPPHDFSLDLFAYWQARHQSLDVQRIPVHFGKRVHGQSSWNVNWRGKKKFIERTFDYSFRLRKELDRRA